MFNLTDSFKVLPPVARIATLRGNNAMAYIHVLNMTDGVIEILQAHHTYFTNIGKGSKPPHCLLFGVSVAGISGIDRRIQAVGRFCKDIRCILFLDGK